MAEHVTVVLENRKEKGEYISSPKKPKRVQSTTPMTRAGEQNSTQTVSFFLRTNDRLVENRVDQEKEQGRPAETALKPVSAIFISGRQHKHDTMMAIPQQPHRRRRELLNSGGNIYLLYVYNMSCSHRSPSLVNPWPLVSRIPYPTKSSIPCALALLLARSSTRKEEKRGWLT